MDALFMSVSTVSVTGMSMFDLKNDFTVFGQLVILFLMQVGGLGIMTMMAMVSISTGRKIRLQERLLIRDSFNLQTPSGMVMLVKKIIFMTLAVEFTSGTLLAIYLYFKYGAIGIYLGYWHAISAFTNCGMDIMGNDVGFAGMAADTFVSTVIEITMFLGAWDSWHWTMSSGTAGGRSFPSTANSFSPWKRSSSLWGSLFSTCWKETIPPPWVP